MSAMQAWRGKLIACVRVLAVALAACALAPAGWT
jgi:hypothetical protein